MVKIFSPNQKEVRRGQRPVNEQRRPHNSCLSMFIDVRQNFKFKMLNQIRGACTVSTTEIGKWNQNNERQMPSISYTWMAVIPPNSLSNISIWSFAGYYRPNTCNLMNTLQETAKPFWKPYGCLKSPDMPKWCFCSEVSNHAALIITNLKESSNIKRSTSPETSSNPSPQGKTLPAILVWIERSMWCSAIKKNNKKPEKQKSRFCDWKRREEKERP